MSARCLLALSAAVLVTWLPLQAQTPAKFETKTYAVADLVVPLPDYQMPPASTSECPGKPARTMEAELMRLIVNTVAPETWEKSGGNGSVEYFPLTMCLVVNQSPEVHKQIGELFEALRRLQELEVTAEVRIVSLPDTFFEQIGLDFPIENGMAGPLTDAQVHSFLEAAQNNKNTNVMQAPRMTLYSGQTATLRVGEDHRLSGTEFTTLPTRCLFKPLNDQLVFIGQNLTLQPTISDDRRTVTVKVEGSLSTINSREGDKANVQRLEVSKTFRIADGRTMLINAGIRTRNASGEHQVPVLTKIPYLNRLFKNTGVETDRVLMLVTPRVVVASEAAQPAVVPAKFVAPEPVATGPVVAMDLRVYAAEPDSPTVLALEMLADQKASGTTFLNEHQTAKLTKIIEADRRVDALSRPHFTTQSGQPASMECGSNDAAGQMMEGVRFTAVPKVSADRRFIALEADCERITTGTLPGEGSGVVVRNVTRAAMNAVVPVGNTAAASFHMAGEGDRRLLLLLTPRLKDGEAGKPADTPVQRAVFTPVPVMPWATEVIEQKIQHKNDFRTPIMPPIQAGSMPICEEPPSDAEVLRAMPRANRGVPFVYEEGRGDVRIVKERLVDKIDAPRFFPLVGPAQLHHCHWKCTVYFTETQQSSFPFPYASKRQRVEVVYIDKDHLHLYPGDQPERIGINFN